MTIWELTQHRLHATTLASVDPATGARTEIGSRVGSVYSTLHDMMDRLDPGDIILIPGEEAPLPGLEPPRLYWVLDITDSNGKTRVIGRSAGGMQN